MNKGILVTDISDHLGTFALIKIKNNSPSQMIKQNFKLRDMKKIKKETFLNLLSKNLDRICERDSPEEKLGILIEKINETIDKLVSPTSNGH